MIRGILWDNDGLLVDSESVYFRANREVLARAGFRLTHKLFAEVSLRQGESLMDLLAARGFSRQQIAALRRERDAHYLRLLRRGVRLFPGVLKTLKILKARGIRMGIVTSSRRVHFDAIHERSGLLPFFEFVLAREDFRNGKPAPDGYRAGLRRLKLPTTACLAVEDSERGLVAARAAGLRCVVIPNRHSAGGDFSRALAVFPSASGLLKLLGEKGKVV